MIGPDSPSVAQIVEDMKSLPPAELESLLRAMTLDDLAAVSARLTAKQRRECGLRHPRFYRAERLREGACP